MKVKASRIGKVAAEAADASALVRAERGLEKTLDRLDMIYRDIVSDPVSIDAEAETAAVSAFISGWVPNFDSEAPWMALAEAVSPMRMDPLAPLTEETAALREQIEALSSRLADDAKAPRVASLERALAELSADVGAARSELAALAASNQLGIWRGLRAFWRRVVPHDIRDFLSAIRHARKS